MLEVGDLLPSIAQRRDVDPDDAQPVGQVLAELTLGDPLLQVGVGGGEHADIHRLRPRLADGHDLALLEEAQQLRLDVERQVADFVEEQRAAGGRADQALLIGDCSGEAAARWPNSWLSASSRVVVVQL